MVFVLGRGQKLTCFGLALTRPKTSVFVLDLVQKPIIFNDDVVCKHGTTIGTLDKEQIFYLQSRGLDKISAEKILLQGIIKNYISDESPLNSFLPKVYQ